MFHLTPSLRATIGGLGLLLLVACQPHASQPETQISGRTMGTFYTVKVSEPFPGGAPALQQQADGLLRKINDEMTTYEASSEVSRFNQFAANQPMPVSQDIAELVMEGMQVGKLTDGVLDVTVGPLVNLWGFGPDKRPVKEPSQAQIAAARHKVGLDKLHVEVNLDGASLRKDIPDLYLDLSTLGEGFAADRLAAFLEAEGIHNYLVEVAGAIRSKGVNGRGEPWRIAIQKPTDELNAMQAVVVPNGMAVSTSGSYRNYYELDGHRYSHIIDPATGRPITHRLVSATVITPTALRADGLDTALMVMGPEKALAFAKAHKLPVYLVSKTDEGFKADYTPEFAKYLVKEE